MSSSTDGPAIIGPGPSIVDCFEAVVELYPNKSAVVCDGRQLTYAELGRAAGHLADFLHENGVGNGDRVGLMAHRSIEAIVAMLGILKAGAAYLPLDPSYPVGMLRQIRSESRAALTLVQRDLGAGMLAGDAGQEPVALIDADGTVCAGPAMRVTRPAAFRPPTADDAAYVMYTSGSTGAPKGVVAAHRGVTRLVRNCDYVSLGADEIILQLAPLAFDACTFEIWGALLNGGQLVIVPAAVPGLDDVAAAIQAHNVTTLWLTAGLFHLMVERRIDSLRSLRQLVAGGDVLSVPHVARAIDGLPNCRLVNGYGPTENTTFTCCYTVPRGRTIADSIPIGTPIRGTTAYILDEAGQPVPDGEDGELYAGGSGVALGYLNQPQLTAERFLSDRFGGSPGARLYRTGDRVRRRPDGNIEFLGRVDRQVKIDGKRVELDAVEARLRLGDGVRDAAVVSRTDAAGRRKLLAFATLMHSGATSASVLRSAMLAEMPAFMVPADIVFLDALPLTPTGKVDRARLAASVPLPPVIGMPTGAMGAGAMPPGGDPTPERLQRIWGRLLGADVHGIDDNFFDLGGTSLQLIEMHAEIVEAFRSTIAVVDLFANPTIRDLSNCLKGGHRTAPRSLSASERAQRRNAALAQSTAALRRPGVSA